MGHCFPWSGGCGECKAKIGYEFEIKQYRLDQSFNVKSKAWVMLQVTCATGQLAFIQQTLSCLQQFSGRDSAVAPFANPSLDNGLLRQPPDEGWLLQHVTWLPLPVLPWQAFYMDDLCPLHSSSVLKLWSRGSCPINISETSSILSAIIYLYAERNYILMPLSNSMGDLCGRFTSFSIEIIAGKKWHTSV